MQRPIANPPSLRTLRADVASDPALRLLAAAPELFEALVAVRRHIGLLPTACRLRVDKALRAAGWTFPQGEQEEEPHDPQPA